LSASRRNDRHLPGIPLDAAITPTADPAALLATDPLLLVVPAQAVRATCRLFPAYRGRVVICAKGLERATGLRLSQVVRQELPARHPRRPQRPLLRPRAGADLPTAVTVAADRLPDAATLAALLASPAFRPYPSDDLPGVELAGALKNVVAIAAGAVAGRSLGENARAALITRGLAEMSRLAEALGAAARPSPASPAWATSSSPPPARPPATPPSAKPSPPAAPHRPPSPRHRASARVLPPPRPPAA
jgi:glycerol-3-phosphate dehydrogenase (NAD(P)+)